MVKKKRSQRGVVTVWWDNPPGPEAGLTIERVVRGFTYTRHVGPRGFLSPTDAAIALNMTREFIYYLIWNKKIKAVKRKGRYAVPLSAIKGYERRSRKKREPFLTG